MLEEISNRIQTFMYNIEIMQYFFVYLNRTN